MSMLNIPVKAILQVIILFSTLVYRWSIEKLESTDYFIVRAAAQEECPTSARLELNLTSLSSARQHPQAAHAVKATQS
jgi:hypothetical protein